MMRALFKNKQVPISPRYYVLVRDKWAKKMSALTLNLSKKVLVFYLILFVLVYAGISLYIVYNALWSKEHKERRAGIDPDHLIVIKPSIDTSNQPALSKTEFENAARFRIYLDSIKKCREQEKRIERLHEKRASH